MKYDDLKSGFDFLKQAFAHALRPGECGDYLHGELHKAFSRLSGANGKRIELKDYWHNRALIAVLAQEWRVFGELKSIKDLSQIDTSKAWNISELFVAARDMPNEFFNGIEHWDVRNVTYAMRTFEGCEHFNQPIGRWKLPRAHFMRGFLTGCRAFNQPLFWDARNIEDMSEFLAGCESFNSKLFRWGGPKGTHYFDGFFRGCRSFNQPLRHWKMKNAHYIDEMFKDCTSFEQDLSCWKMPNLCSANDAFAGCCNDAKLPHYEVHAYVNYFVDEELFEEEDAQLQPVLKLFPASRGELIGSLQALAQLFSAGESVDLSIINTSNVGSFSELFKEAGLCDMPNEFFAGIERWDTSGVMFFDSCFAGCEQFNQPIGCWDVSASCDFTNMFEDCFCFDQPLDHWQINGSIFGACKIAGMFKNCRSFNQPLGSWDVSDCEDFTQLFAGCESFNQPLGRWDMKSARRLEQMFSGCSALEQDFSGWEFRDVIGFTSANVYIPDCAKDMFKGTLVAPAMQPQMLIQRGLLPNLAAKKRPASKNSGAREAVYAPKSTAELKNLIEQLAKEYRQHKKFLRIKSLADIDVSAVCSMREVFVCRETNYFLPAEFYAGVECWDVSSCVDFSQMFMNCTTFNQPIGCWDVSAAKTMYGMFWCCDEFNQPLGGWDVSNCENFADMFGGCRKFNQPLDGWDVGQGKDFTWMFAGCKALVQDFSGWKMPKKAKIYTMFDEYPLSLLPKTLANIRRRMKDGLFLKPLNIYELRSSLCELAKEYSKHGKFIRIKSLADIDVSALSSLNDAFGYVWNKNIANEFFAGIERWDVSGCADFAHMFEGFTHFAQDLSGWEIRSIQGVKNMFKNTAMKDTFMPRMLQGCDLDEGGGILITPFVQQALSNMAAKRRRE